MTPLPATIRPAETRDVPAIARVHVDSWQSTYAGLLDPDYLASLSYAAREAAWQRILSQPDMGTRRFALVAEYDGQVCGFAAGGPNRDDNGYDAEMYAIYLLSETQGQGLGRLLFSGVSQRLQGAGFRSLILWVLDGNPTIRFYEHMGGQRIGDKTLMIGLQTCVAFAYGWSDLESITESDHQKL